MGALSLARRELVPPSPLSSSLLSLSSSPLSLSFTAKHVDLSVRNVQRYVICIALSRPVRPSKVPHYRSFSRHVFSQQVTLRSRVTASGHFLYGNTRIRCAKRPNHPSVCVRRSRGIDAAENTRSLVKKQSAAASMTSHVQRGTFECETRHLRPNGLNKL